MVRCLRRLEVGFGVRPMFTDVFLERHARHLPQLSINAGLHRGLGQCDRILCQGDGSVVFTERMSSLA